MTDPEENSSTEESKQTLDEGITDLLADLGIFEKEEPLDVELDDDDMY